MSDLKDEIRHLPPRLSDIGFDQLSAREWRVSDRRYPPRDIEAVLGFVASYSGLYYATRMHHPLEATPFTSLDRVAEFFAEQP